MFNLNEFYRRFGIIPPVVNELYSDDMTQYEALCSLAKTVADMVSTDERQDAAIQKNAGDIADNASEIAALKSRAVYFLDITVRNNMPITFEKQGHFIPRVEGVFGKTVKEGTTVFDAAGNYFYVHYEAGSPVFVNPAEPDNINILGITNFRSVVAANVARNKALIDENAHAIAENDRDIDANSEAIASNGLLIADNADSIVRMQGDITDIDEKVAANQGEISTMKESISTNSGLIEENAHGIAENARSIAANVEDITNNAALIADNADSIARMQSDILDIDGNVAANQADIAAIKEGAPVIVKVSVTADAVTIAEVTGATTFDDLATASATKTISAEITTETGEKSDALYTVGRDADNVTLELFQKKQNAEKKEVIGHVATFTAAKATALVGATGTIETLNAGGEGPGLIVLSKKSNDDRAKVTQSTFETYKDLWDALSANRQVLVRIQAGGPGTTDRHSKWFKCGIATYSYAVLADVVNVSIQAMEFTQYNATKWRYIELAGTGSSALLGDSADNDRVDVYLTAGDPFYKYAVPYLESYIDIVPDSAGSYNMVYAQSREATDNTYSIFDNIKRREYTGYGLTFKTPDGRALYDYTTYVNGNDCRLYFRDDDNKRYIMVKYDTGTRTKFIGYTPYNTRKCDVSAILNDTDGTLTAKYTIGETSFDMTAEDVLSAVLDGTLTNVIIKTGGVFGSYVNTGTIHVYTEAEGQVFSIATTSIVDGPALEVNYYKSADVFNLTGFVRSTVKYKLTQEV